MNTKSGSLLALLAVAGTVALAGELGPITSAFAVVSGSPTTTPTARAKAVIRDASGNVRGSLQVVEYVGFGPGDSRIDVVGRVTGLPGAAGAEFGVHVWEGDCSTDDGTVFTSVSSHLASGASANHPRDMGDLPNAVRDSTGVASVRFTKVTNRFVLRSGIQNAWRSSSTGIAIGIDPGPASEVGGSPRPMLCGELTCDSSLPGNPCSQDAPPPPPPPITFASCDAIQTVNPSAADGVYTIDPGSGERDVYCDMTGGGVTYEQLGFGRHTQAYPGYTEVSVADLQNAQRQQAFIYLYNAQGGAAINLQVGYNSANCCFKAADTAASRYIFLGPSYIYPATTSNVANCNLGYNDPAYRFYYGAQGTFPPNPLPTDYFATRPASIAAGCSDNNNPAFFWRRY